MKVKLEKINTIYVIAPIFTALVLLALLIAERLSGLHFYLFGFLWGWMLRALIVMIMLRFIVFIMTDFGNSASDPVKYNSAVVSSMIVFLLGLMLVSSDFEMKDDSGLVSFRQKEFFVVENNGWVNYSEEIPFFYKRTKMNV